MNKLYLVLLIWNIIVFVLYGIDKKKAVKHQYRISESTLLSCAFLFGSIGALSGMLYFHHKTKKMKFITSISLFLLLHISFCYWLVNI